MQLPYLIVRDNDDHWYYIPKEEIDNFYERLDDENDTDFMKYDMYRTWWSLNNIPEYWVNKLYNDWFHTMDELYEHRCRLFIALCKEIMKLLNHQVWVSKQHYDWTSFNWRFIMWINEKPWTIITYHIPDKYRDTVTTFAMVLDKWLERDWHTSSDVLERLLEL